MTKRQLVSSLDELPENPTIDQVVDHIFFVSRVQTGLSDSLNGNLNSKDEAKTWQMAKINLDRFCN
jgi:hypothetical protein